MSCPFPMGGGNPSEARSVDVALVVDADRGRGAVLLCGSAPNAVLVLGQGGDMGIALGLDLLLRLHAGEAVGALDRDGGIVLVHAFYRRILRPGLSRIGALGKSGRSGRQHE